MFSGDYFVGISLMACQLDKQVLGFVITVWDLLSAIVNRSLDKKRVYRRTE